MAVALRRNTVPKEQKERIEELRAEFEVRLQSFFSDLPHHRGFCDALQYALIPGGKRIRPLLSLLTYEDLGGLVEDFYPIALCLELLHCASLVHDDLPALDDDELRRGRPSLHIAYNEATAVLVGDALPALIMPLIESTPIAVERKFSVVSALLHAQMKLCEGQYLDLDSELRSKALLSIHRAKTGALFACCFEVSAAAAGQAVEDLKEFGLQFGIYFQLVDDLLDQISPSKVTGKLANSDDRNDRFTWFSNDSLEDGFKRLDEIEDELYRLFHNLEESASAGVSYRGISWVLHRIQKRKSDAIFQWQQRTSNT